MRKIDWSYQKTTSHKAQFTDKLPYCSLYEVVRRIALFTDPSVERFLSEIYPKGVCLDRGLFVNQDLVNLITRGWLVAHCGRINLYLAIPVQITTYNEL